MAELEHIFFTDRAPWKSPNTPAVRCGNQLWLSGIPGRDANGYLPKGDFTAQMTLAMQNVDILLREGGASWDRVVKATMWLTRAEDFAEMNRIYTGWFPGGKYPARTTAIITALPIPDFLLEIECVAVLS